MLTENDKIRERRQRFFAKLLNGEGVRGDCSRGEECSDQRAGDQITKEEIRETLKKMSNRKTVGPDQIPVEVWKFMGEVSLEWLTELFNFIFRTAKMPRERMASTVIPLYKNKGDIQDCNNFRGIKLLSHTMKLWERVIERRLREDVEMINLKFDPFSILILPLFSYNLSSNLSKKGVEYTFLTYYALNCPIS